jgi:ParB family transcriptional regulator, chromosome partitioning protein
MIRNAARETLVQVLSCRENHSASGMGARYAGTAIDADAYLPNMATEEFLPALSRAALEQSAAAHSVAPQPRVKDTRAALIARFADGTFVYPAARFAPTEAELEARRNPASIFGEGDDDEESADGEIEVAHGELNDDHDPTGEEDDGTARPDDDEPQAGMIASGIDCQM